MRIEVEIINWKINGLKGTFLFIAQSIINVMKSETSH